MGKHHQPRSGSRSYRPLKRAKNIKPRMTAWPEATNDSKILGFTGYKAGMTHCIAIDETENSPTHGSEIFVPVTIIETPPMKIAGIRIYQAAYLGTSVFTDIWCDTQDENLKRRTSLPKKKSDSAKKIAEVTKSLENISDIKLIAHTQPLLTHSPQKVPDIMELAISGEISEKLEYAKEVLGKEINISDVLSEQQFCDLASITKGKGFTGVIKRYGVRKQPRKATGKRRHLGTGGAWKPQRKLWVEPLPGQLGFHTRTEFNKFILKIGQNGEEITPKGGFLKYGPVKSNYVMIYGSVPGPAKRIIRFSFTRRAHSPMSLSIKHIDQSSKQGM